MLHHGQIDHIYAVYQDYYGQDQIPKSSLGSSCYTTGRGIGLDSTMPFVAGAGNYPQFFLKKDGTPPTPRDVIHNVGDTIQVTYANDYLALVLAGTDSSYYSKNNATWIQLATGTVNEITCSRRLEESSGTITVDQAVEILEIPEGTPQFTDLATRLLYANLTAAGLSAQDALNTIAYRDCAVNGNQLKVTPEWITMQGMENSTDLFRCFTYGDPNDCIPNIGISSNDAKFDFDYEPVRITAFGDTSVEFALSQVWMSDSVDKVGVHFTGTDGFSQCDSLGQVFPGEFGVYQAKCFQGVATVKLYAMDSTITASAPDGSSTTLCGNAGIRADNTYVHTITIPCSLEGPQCPLPLASEPICDGSASYAVATDIFTNSNDTDAWVFGDVASNNAVGTFLELEQGTSKTYRVPSSANSVKIELEIYEVDCSRAASVTLLVGSVLVDLGMFDCDAHDGKHFESEGVDVEVISVDNRADMVVLTIPSEFYKKRGRLPIGIRNSLIGIGSLTMTADCTAIVPVWQDPEVLSVIDHVIVP